MSYSSLYCIPLYDLEYKINIISTIIITTASLVNLYFSLRNKVIYYIIYKYYRSRSCAERKFTIDLILRFHIMLIVLKVI